MSRPVKSFLLLAALIGCVGHGFVSSAQQPEAVAPSPRFDVTRYEVVGNTLLSAQEVERLVAPHVGPGKDFSDVQRALEAVEQGYRERGYGIVQVLLPEQDITKGVVQFRVLEPRVGRVIIEGNNFFNEENIRYSLPSIKEGTTPNSRQIARNLQPLNEHPVKQTSVVMRAGASEDQVDVAVKIADERPYRFFATMDNTGTGETGYMRTGIGFQHTNVLNRDHAFTAQYITSPTQIDDVTIIGVGYRIPFYRWNSSLDLIAGYSNVDSGNVQGLFNVAGSGKIGAVRWNYFLPKFGELEHKLSLGWDYREFKSNLSSVDGLDIGVPTPDITLHPLSLTYSALRRFAAAELSFYGAISRNIPFGQDGDGDAFQRDGQRVGANPRYTIFRYGGTYAHAFGDWQARATFNAQYTSDALVAGEQFGIGGPDSVRGYIVREISNDRGYNAQFELYTPDLARKVGLQDSSRLRFLAFYDMGSVDRNDALPGELAHDSIASAGLGVRYNFKKSISVRADVAQILQATPARSTSSQRVSAAVAVIF